MLSYWEKSTVASHCDIMIIGGGLTGLLSAFHASGKFPKKRIRIIERGPFPFGASTRNAGFACFGSPSELVEDIEKDGEDMTLQRVEQRFRGLQFYLQNFNPDSFDFTKTGGWEIFRDSESEVFDNLKDKLPYLNDFLKEIVGDITYEVDRETSRFGMHLYDRSFLNKHEGQLHPAKLCLLLEKTLRERGVQIVNGVEITSLDASPTIIAQDASGIEWTAESCIVATNGLAKQLLPDENIYPARGQVIMTNEIPGLKPRGTFHLDRGYWYFRNVGDRLLLGGGRHLNIEGERTGERDTTQLIQTELENLLRGTLLRDVNFKIEHRWAGTMAFGLENEKTPRIEALSDNLIIAARLGGMGVA
ncbi:MAG: FAD-binding oxidoreductase, partial [Flavobacteriia bacterium]|nr:FAD-binding oxidoreductase [Flavobacteriia bacterium]